MRSLIILELEHGEDTDALESIVAAAYDEAVVQRRARRFVKVNNYTVRVDLPACFVLDSDHTDNKE